MDRLAGERIRLRPLTLNERKLFFKWATHSDATPFWYGDLYGDEVPSYSIFKLEWPDHYFLGNAPHMGRAYGIELNGRLIGEINYNEINEVDYSVSLDVIIAEKTYHNKGYGTEAIVLLTRFLFDQYEIRKSQIEVISKNPRAYRAFEKAGYYHVYTYVRHEIVWHVLECMNKPAYPQHNGSRAPRQHAEKPENPSR
ncbi:MAG: GNAT family N-acetyltransferase [Bacteroidota bacterium]